MIEANYKYICPKCKNTYTSSVQLIYCVCGASLVPQTPDPLGALKEIFEDTGPIADLFKR